MASLLSFSTASNIQPLSASQQKTALNNFMLNTSGWRKKFNPPAGKPQQINLTDASLLTTAFANLICFFNQKLTSNKTPYLIFALDSRPSGPALSKLLLLQAAVKKISTNNTSITNRLKVISLGITSLPQTLCYVASCKKAIGFIYLTASHNPAVYNGIKFGLSDGKILNAIEAAKVKNSFLRRLQSPLHSVDIKNTFTESSLPKTEAGITASNKKYLQKTSSVKILPTNLVLYSPKFYQESITNYITLLHNILSSEKPGASQEKYITNFKKWTMLANIKVLLNYNGSSRIRSADVALLKSLGIKPIVHNAELGKFNHTIVPEGNALKITSKAMQKTGASIGLAFDCDGDRGNLVIASPQEKIKILGAQASFAIAVISEVVFCQIKNPTKKIAIIANDATSISFETIASRFNIKAFRAEVGEANILNLQQQKEKKNYLVPIVGEGSNGGNIVNKHTVRDPMATLLCSLRLALDDDVFSIAINKLKIKCGNLIAINSHKPKKNAHNTLLKRLAVFNNFQQQIISTEVFEKQSLLPASMLKEIGFRNLLHNFSTHIADKGLCELSKICLPPLQKYFMIEKKTNQYLDRQPLSIAAKPVFTFGTKRVNSAKKIPLKVSNCGVSCYLHAKRGKKIMPSPFALLWFRPSATEPVIRVATEVAMLQLQADKKSAEQENIAKKNNKALQQELLLWLRRILTKILTT